MRLGNVALGEGQDGHEREELGRLPFIFASARIFKELSVMLAKLVFSTIVAIAAFEIARAQIPPSAIEVGSCRGRHAAAARGDADEIMRLVRAGADVHARDANGRTPLHVAAYRGDSASVRALLAGKADP